MYRIIGFAIIEPCPVQAEWLRGWVPYGMGWLSGV